LAKRISPDGKGLILETGNFQKFYLYVQCFNDIIIEGIVPDKPEVLEPA
jgi:hypothetical protein